MMDGATTGVHSLARRSLAVLGLPEPIQRDEFLRSADFIDCVSNINPFSGEFGQYPQAIPRELQERYGQVVVEQLRSRGETLDDDSIRGENILFTEGSVSAIDLLTRAFCEPFRDRVCVCNPTFPFYQRAARANDVQVIDIPLKGDGLDELDVPAICAVEPKLTFLCSPGNPVGSVLEPRHVEQVLTGVLGLVIIDEAYIDFSERSSFARWLGRFPHLVVLRTFSKAWGLAGVRVGAVIADPLVLQTLRTIQLTYGFGSPAQRLVARRLEEVRAVDEQVALIRVERERLRAGLVSLPFVTRAYPSEANFLFVKVVDADAIQAGLLKSKILVANMSFQVPNTVRISVGSPASNARFLEVARTLA
jgi:histidinol-phosphate aminotransferase